MLHLFNKHYLIGDLVSATLQLLSEIFKPISVIYNPYPLWGYNLR